MYHSLTSPSNRFFKFTIHDGRRVTSSFKRMTLESIGCKLQSQTSLSNFISVLKSDIYLTQVHCVEWFESTVDIHCKYTRLLQLSAQIAVSNTLTDSNIIDVLTLLQFDYPSVVKDLSTVISNKIFTPQSSIMDIFCQLCIYNAVNLDNVIITGSPVKMLMLMLDCYLKVSQRQTSIVQRLLNWIHQNANSIEYEEILFGILQQFDQLRDIGNQNQSFLCYDNILNIDADLSLWLQCIRYFGFVDDDTAAKQLRRVLVGAPKQVITNWIQVTKLQSTAFIVECINNVFKAKWIYLLDKHGNVIDCDSHSKQPAILSWQYIQLYQCQKVCLKKYTYFRQFNEYLQFLPRGSSTLTEKFIREFTLFIPKSFNLPQSSLFITQETQIKINSGGDYYAL